MSGCLFNPSIYFRAAFFCCACGYFRIVSKNTLPTTEKARSRTNTGIYDPVDVRIAPANVATNDVGISVRFVMLKFKA